MPIYCWQMPDATGANFTVPQGLPNDTFPMGVTSGERVIVIPKGLASRMESQPLAMGAGGGANAMYVNEENNYYITDQKAAALLMALFPIGLSAEGLLPLTVGLLATARNLWAYRKAAILPGR